MNKRQKKKYLKDIVVSFSVYSVWRDWAQEINAKMFKAPIYDVMFAADLQNTLAARLKSIQSDKRKGCRKIWEPYLTAFMLSETQEK